MACEWVIKVSFRDGHIVLKLWQKKSSFIEKWEHYEENCNYSNFIDKETFSFAGRMCQSRTDSICSQLTFSIIEMYCCPIPGEAGSSSHLHYSFVPSYLPPRELEMWRDDGEQEQLGVVISSHRQVSLSYQQENKRLLFVMPSGKSRWYQLWSRWDQEAQGWSGDWDLSFANLIVKTRLQELLCSQKSCRTCSYLITWHTFDLRAPLNSQIYDGLQRAFIDMKYFLS